LNDKRDKMQGLTEKFASIAALQQMRLDMDVFVESTDYPGALQIAEDIRKTLADDRVLAELSCFRKLPEHIERTVSKVRNVMIGDFVAGASLPRDAKAVVSPKTLENLSKVAAANGLKPPAANFNEAPQFGDKRGNVLDTTIPPFIALLFSGSSFVCDALEAWSSAMSEDVRQIEHVAVDVMLSRVTGERVKSSTTSMEEGVFDSAYANAIRKLPGEVFVEMLVALTETFNAYFERANQIKLVIRGVIGNDEEALTQLRSIDENLILAAHEAATNFDYVCSQTALATSNEALNKVIDIAQGRFAKILGIRAPMNINLSAREFMRIMDATNGFLDSAESLGKHRCLSLRSTVANQSKAFIREQHATASTKLVSLLECETWALAKLPKHFQALVDALADGTSKLPDVMSEDVGDASFVVVADEKFHPVNSAVLLLQMLTDYVRLARQIPSLSTEVTHRTIDLVKQYNTAVCQLILGAGAMQVSKLKSITAKHLCLAQQSVSLFASLLPTLQEAMCALIEGPKHVLLRQEFERMLRDLKLHKSEIHDKLVSIMRDRVEFHLHRLASIVESLRDEGNVKQVDGASDFAISLTKEMGTLRRVICELLSEDDRRDVLGRVRDEAVASIVSRVQSLESGDNLRIIAQLSVDLDVCADSMKEMPVSGADASEDALASLASAFRLKVPPPVVNEPVDDVSAREKEQVGQNKAADDKPSTD
jgi:vacuolar protein sorting-associated protein 54